MNTLFKRSFLTLCACASLMIPGIAWAETGDNSTPKAPAAPAKVDSPIEGAEVFDECKVAVLPFKSETIKCDKNEINPGKTIARILEGRLSKKRFVIMSRELGDVKEEQALNNGEGFSAEGASNLGELEGVEYLITGNVMQLTIEQGKTTQSGFVLFAESKKEANKAHVDVEINVKDTDSGRVVASASCRKTIEIGTGSSSSASIVHSAATSDQGDATTEIYNVCYQIADDLAQQLNTMKFAPRAPKLNLQGTVALVEPGCCYINLGAKNKVTKKMVFNVYRMRKGIKVIIAEVRPISISDTSSECKIVNLRKGKSIKPGDRFETKF